MVSLYMTAALTLLFVHLALAFTAECPSFPDWLPWRPTIGNSTKQYDVFLNVTSCENGSIAYEIQQMINLSDKDFVVSLWYDCTNATGNTVGEVLMDRRLSEGKINEFDLSSLDPLTCTLFGYFVGLDINQDYCFEVQNSTCTFDYSVVELPTTVSAVQTSRKPGPTPTGSLSVYMTRSTTLLPTMTSAPDDLTTTPAEFSMTLTNSETSTLGEHCQVWDDLVIIVTSLLTLVCIVGVSILALFAILLKFRPTQRKKLTNWQRTFYKQRKAKEPFDPDFVPTDFDFSAKLNKYLSIMSVFDPYDPHNVSDDEKSEVLQGTSWTKDNSSIPLATLKDSDGVFLDSPPEKAVVDDSSGKEPCEINGYVSTDSTAKHKEQLSAISNGYAVTSEKPELLSTVAPESEAGFEQKTQLSNSGYVNSGVRVSSPTSTKDKPSHMYTTLNNGYTILLSQQYPRKEVPSEEDLDPVYCDNDLEGNNRDQLHFERIAEECNNIILNEAYPELTKTSIMTTECSLSINPLHFEPVTDYDELMQEQTSPPYVNI